MKSDFDMPAINKFIVEYFDDNELELFSSEYFRDVFNDFTPAMRMTKKASMLVEYCYRRGRLSDLMAALKRERSQLFEQVFSQSAPSNIPEMVFTTEEKKRNTAQIFLSHAHQDSEFAQRLAKDLNRNGWEIWIAPNSIKPGEKWVEAINRGLEESGIIALVLTNTAVQSNWVKNETNIAIELESQEKIHFIPLLVEQTELPLLWRSYQHIRFDENYNTGLKSLLEELKYRTSRSSNELISPVKHRNSTNFDKGTRDKISTILREKRMIIMIAPIFLLVVIWVLFFRNREQLVSNEIIGQPTLESENSLSNAITTDTGNGEIPPSPTLQLPNKQTISETQPSPPQPTYTIIAAITTEPSVNSNSLTVIPALNEICDDFGCNGDTMIREYDNAVMVYVPGGTFPMGSEVNDLLAEPDEFPAHPVKLDGFWIDQTEVTNGQYALCGKENECITYFSQFPNYGDKNQPIVGVWWQEAQDFCELVGGRLPTEAEWEYAARGPNGLRYPWGNDFDGSKLNFCDSVNCDRYEVTEADDGFTDTAPVGSYPDGASWVGAFDMLGNVWEWVIDWYVEDIYIGFSTTSATLNPIGPDLSNEDGYHSPVMRGGAFDTPHRETRAANRALLQAASHLTGFRCVVDP